MQLPYLFSISRKEIIPFFKHFIRGVVLGETIRGVKLEPPVLRTVEPDERPEFNMWAKDILSCRN